jgi:hypothetical protein
MGGQHPGVPPPNDDEVPSERKAEIEHALLALASSLARLLHKSDGLWDAVGHRIPILITALPRPRMLSNSRLGLGGWTMRKRVSAQGGYGLLGAGGAQHAWWLTSPPRPGRRSVNGRLAQLGFRIFGAPPPREAPKEQRLRWIRRFYLRPLPLYISIYLLAAISTPPPWVWALLGVSALTWLHGFASLSLRIRRTRNDT